MVFRDDLIEEREIGTWAVREKIGKLQVTVLHNDQKIAGADVKVRGLVVVSNPSGVATIDLPEGAYSVEVGVMMNGLFFEGKGSAQVKGRITTEVSIALKDPPEFKRIVSSVGTCALRTKKTSTTTRYWMKRSLPVKSDTARIAATSSNNDLCEKIRR